MKKLFMLLVFIGMVTFTYSQWSFQTCDPSTGLKDVFFVNSIKGWAIGDNGIILYTSNGGELWSIQNSGTMADLRSVCFPSENVGYIVGGNGYEGVMLKSIDGGQNWNIQSPEQFDIIYDCYFTDNDTGYVVTNYNDTCAILKTMDGGTNWVDLNISDTVVLHRIHFINPNIGFAVGFKIPNYTAYSYIIKTIDGGQNWSNVTPDIPDFALESVQMIDENIVYVGGHINEIGPSMGRLLKTTDGGSNWDIFSMSGGNGTFTFTDVNTGYWPYLWGVYKTLDGGLNWISQTIDSVPPVAYPRRAIYFPTTDTGYIVGDGLILKTTNGGGTVGLMETVPSIGHLQVYPNPAINKAVMSFDLLKEEDVSISIYNMKGQKMEKIHLGKIQRGQYELEINEYSQGIYLLTINTESGILTEKLIIE